MALYIQKKADVTAAVTAAVSTGSLSHGRRLCAAPPALAAGEFPASPAAQLLLNLLADHVACRRR
eukprot:13626060-Alexandrium_andersonii.AAC.1